MLAPPEPTNVEVAEHDLPAGARRRGPGVVNEKYCTDVGVVL